MLSIAKQNRSALFDKLEPNSIAILPSAKLSFRSRDVEYPFRQNSDFLYVTAFSEPNAVAIFIRSDGDASSNQFILFHQRTDLIYNTWHGESFSSQQIIDLFGADLVYYTDQLEEILPELLVGKEMIYYPMLAESNSLNFLQQAQIKAISIAKKTHRSYPHKIYQDLLVVIHELRVFKSNLELEKIRFVTKRSAEAHNHIMRYVASHKNLTEKQIFAEFYRHCLQNGCDDMAYQPIVAAGHNACILHYSRNLGAIKAGELLLLDAGAEYQCYAADITRVFPVNGRFSSQQKAIYNLVLLAQKQAIQKIRPKELWSNIQKEIIEVLVEGLIELKILQGKRSDLISNGAYRNFYMHNSGHFLGLDVHDVGDYRIGERSRDLQEGMVLTVEPGLYFSKDCEVAPEWRGIGIRIEDDILVTANGSEILTSTAIKEIADIEDLMLH